MYINVQSTVGAGTTLVCTSSVPPRLTFARNGSTNTLIWPSWAIGYQPVWTTNLASSAWSSATGPISVQGYQTVLLHSNTLPDALYRLKK